MDSDSNSPLLEIFLTSAKMEDPKARIAYIQRACEGNAELLHKVEMLLAAEARAGGPPPESAAQVGSDPNLGSCIGQYKLLEQIGEGGCGVVYMAEQEQPVRRKVALKIIKLGMDTKQVVARFEAERQALAMMDHPNIARVLDAGTTDPHPQPLSHPMGEGGRRPGEGYYGRPYFVMELVRGIKITDYCDEHQLSTRQRLDLFMQVCHAVQHAHQKGIIHRDLKPSNVLVTEVDGKPVPKVIDFGIAKAVEGRLTDNTLFTAFEQLVGTPSYMSPEQASLVTSDIDTRTDIYSLGVMLYQLLTGETPFDTKALLASGLDAMRRTISEKIPDRPSNRLTSMTPEQVKAVARAHRSEPSRFAHLLVGDLDWIVMKCLEKDRARRYETANGLAMDLQRHLNNEPIIARPPSRLYEFQKTVRRHWVGFTAAAAIMLVLVVGVTVSTWLAVRAVRAEHQQTQLRIDAEAALNALRSGEDGVLERLGDPTNALAVLEHSVQRWPDQPLLWAIRASLLEQNGHFEDAINDISRSIQLLESEPTDSSSYLNELLLSRHRLLMEQGRVADAGIDNCRARGIPLRDSAAPGTAIDLSAFYDAPLTESLQNHRGTTNCTLAELGPPGLRLFNNRLFDVRGVVQLKGATLIGDRYYSYPRQVTRIPIGLKFRRLHAFIATGWNEPDGTQIGSYVLHYVGGASEELPILYGLHVRDFVANPDFNDGGDAPLEHARVVWTGMNPTSLSFNAHVRLYVATWDNPRPDELVANADFISSMTDCALVTIAMSVEP